MDAAASNDQHGRPPFDNTRAVIAWALCTGVLSAALAGCGLRAVAIALASATALVGGVILVVNWDHNGPEWTGRRETYRRRVIAALAICPVLPLVAFVVTEVAGSGAPDAGGLWVPRAAILSAAVATCAICLSSLIDWSYTAPLLRGRPHGPRPCTASTDERWRALTRNWLLHRMISYTVVRVAVGVVVGILLIGLMPKTPETATSVLTAAAALYAAYVFSRVTAVAALSQNPPLRIGDAVVLAEEYGTGIQDRPIYYVVDIAVEGIQLRELDRDARVASGPVSHDRTLELKDVNRLLRGRLEFTGCGTVCSRVNKYCPLNKDEPTRPTAAQG